MVDFCENAWQIKVLKLYLLINCLAQNLIEHTIHHQHIITAINSTMQTAVEISRSSVVPARRHFIILALPHINTITSRYMSHKDFINHLLS